LNEVALNGAAATPPQDPPSSHTSLIRSSSKRIKKDLVESVTCDVALKIIPKKKVKGNESAVWGEMEVLKGLDHPNIVRSLG
jgi:calcium/calmodulin-dependent protein kinase I